MFIYIRSSACGWRYKYAPKLMQTFYQASNSSDVFAHSPVVSESHFLNIPCPVQGGYTVLGTSQVETQMFGSWLLKFLELPWTRGERPEVVQHYLFCLVSYQFFKTAQQIKCGHFLSARPTRATSTVWWTPAVPPGCWGLPVPHREKAAPPACSPPRNDLPPDRSPRPNSIIAGCCPSAGKKSWASRCLVHRKARYPAVAALVTMPEGLLDF